MSRAVSVVCAVLVLVPLAGCRARDRAAGVEQQVGEFESALHDVERELDADGG